jgi:Trm5-related predicted tRNA methylase
VTLSAANMEWIRRLPPRPSTSDRAALRAMRRRSVAPDERRLLDSLLAPVEGSASRRAERARLERRLATLDASLSANGQERAKRNRQFGAQRIASQKATAVRRMPIAQRDEPATPALVVDLKQRRRTMERERLEIKSRLRDLTREIRRFGVSD